jgi:hypothetical protein
MFFFVCMLSNYSFCLASLLVPIFDLEIPAESFRFGNRFVEFGGVHRLDFFDGKSSSQVVVYSREGIRVAGLEDRAREMSNDLFCKPGVCRAYFDSLLDEFRADFPIGVGFDLNRAGECIKRIVVNMKMRNKLNN